MADRTENLKVFFEILLRGSQIQKLTRDNLHLVREACQQLDICINPECGHPANFYKTLCQTKHCLGCLQEKLTVESPHTCLCEHRLSAKNVFEIQGKPLHQHQRPPELVARQYGECQHLLHVEDKISCRCPGGQCLECRLKNLHTLTCHRCSTTYDELDVGWLIEQCSLHHGDWLKQCKKCNMKTLITSGGTEGFCVRCDKESSVPMSEETS